MSSRINALDNKLQTNALVKNSVAVILLGFMLITTAAHAGYCDRVLKWGGKRVSCEAEYSFCAYTKQENILLAQDLYDNATTPEEEKAALRQAIGVNLAYISCNNGTKRKYLLSYNPNVANAVTKLASETQTVLVALGDVAKQTAARLRSAIIKFGGLVGSSGEVISGELTNSFNQLHDNLDVLTDEARHRLAEILFGDLSS